MVDSIALTTELSTVSLSRVYITPFILASPRRRARGSCLKLQLMCPGNHANPVSFLRGFPCVACSRKWVFERVPRCGLFKKVGPIIAKLLYYNT